MIKLFLGTLLFSVMTWAQTAPSTEITADQVKFTFLSSEGDYWANCTHDLADENTWIATCGEYKFNLHMLLKEYASHDGTTFEFHYWATETALLKETHTQSTWLTVDQPATVKNIIGYLGFVNDSMQLRIQVNLNK